jgi:hypothetical protein
MAGNDAFKEAQVEHVAKIVYDKLIEEIKKGTETAEKVLASKPDSYTVATIILILVLSNATNRAAEDMKRFGIGDKETDG